MGLVEHDQPVGVLVVGQRRLAGGASRTGQSEPGQLRITRELLIADDLRGQPSLVKPILPVISKLGRHHEQDVLAPPDGVLLHERKADLRLARAHAVGVHDTVAAADDGERAPEAVVLERGQLDGVGGRKVVVLVQVVPQKLQQRAQVDGARVEEARVGKEQLAKPLLEVVRFLPQPIEPLHRPLGHGRIVVDQSQLQVPPHARRRQVGGGHQRGSRVPGVAEQVRLPVKKLVHVAPHRHVGPIQPLLHGEQPLQCPAGRKARQVPLVAKRQQRPFEEGGRDFVADPGGHGAQQEAGAAVSVLGQRGQVAQTAQVHVARRDGEAVAIVEVVGKVGQGVAVVGGVGLVVEEGGALDRRHYRGDPSCLRRSRPAGVRRYRCLLLRGLSGIVISISPARKAGSR